MRVLITGGAGYVGTEIIQALSGLDNIDSIVIYDNLSRKNYNLFIHKNLPKQNVSLVRGDLLDSRKLKKAVQESDVVIHLAAVVITPFSNESPHQFEQVNNWGTAELCYAIEESDIQRVIYLSSLSVYGSSDQIVNEQSPTNPKTFYGISKLRGEDHINRLKDKTETIILRCGNIYGFSPALRFDAVINRFMFEANYENRITIQGDGKQKRAFIPISNVIKALVPTVFGKLPGGIYNLADKNLSILELSATIKEIYPALEFLFVNQHIKLRNIELDLNLKIREYIPLQATDLPDDLREFASHFSFHPNGIRM